ncbi:MAG: redoxin domain-containing protein [Anaerolineaceae bacterium]|nr:redoxin domain-containing protein [Anaerolineaceae bacterium]
MLRWLMMINLLLLAGCTTLNQVPQSTEVPKYPYLGTAPELVGDTWLNTDTPLRLDDLKGKVILVEMWTFGCINCRNVIPSLRKFHEEYANQGLVIIGNHFPEFGYEKDVENLKHAIVELEIPYAIVVDNEGSNWQAYQNIFWPTLYLIDKTGEIRYKHIGEGKYEETEIAIRSLLVEN